MQLGEWLNERQAAEWLALPETTIRDAVHAGEIPALTIGGQTRISKAALLALATTANGTRQAQPSSAVAAAPSSVTDAGLPTPKGLVWLEELRQRGADHHVWPNGVREEYPEAYEGTVSLNGDKLAVKVGIGVRPVSTGKDQPAQDRGRMVVRFNGYPVAEFVKTADGAAWASVVKPDGKKALQAGTPPPALYRGARLLPYRDITGTAGVGVPSGLALVIEADDYRSAVHHAAARRLGRERYPVEPSNS